MREVYLDNNATTRPLPKVVQAVSDCMARGWANPSSAHSAGRRARESVEHARDSVRTLVGASTHRLIFTSGGTESNSMVFQSIRRTGGHRRVITTAAEHSSVLENADALRSEGFEVVLLPIDARGHVDLDQLSRELSEGADLVAVHWVNNETGVIQPIAEIAALCAERETALLVDGAQAFGKIPMNLSRAPISYLSFSGHKIHGPQGVGGLFASDVDRLQPLIRGGDQEEGVRAGTYNLPAIVGLGEAARLRRERFDAVSDYVSRLRDDFEALVMREVGATVNGDQDSRVGNTTNLCFHGLDGQALLARLDGSGVFASQGSACTSQRPEPSPVLTAMGLSEDDAYASIRFSFSELNDDDDVGFAVREAERHCHFLRSMASGAVAL